MVEDLGMKALISSLGDLRKGIKALFWGKKEGKGGWGKGFEKNLKMMKKNVLSYRSGANNDYTGLCITLYSAA